VTTPTGVKGDCSGKHASSLGWTVIQSYVYDPMRRLSDVQTARSMHRPDPGRPAPEAEAATLADTASVRFLCKRVFVQLEGAHLKERAKQGGWIEWWVVIVQRSVLSSQNRCEQTRAALEDQLGQPVVLMAQDARGRPTYWGRPDLVDYMAAQVLEAIPWQRFTLNAA
jgi:hypothetical protein